MNMRCRTQRPIFVFFVMSVGLLGGRLESGPMSQAAADATGGAGSDGASLQPAAESAYWQFLDSWSERIKVAATLDRETLMGLHLAVDGGYVPIAWVEKRYPAVSKQLIILRNHKAAVDRSCIQWSWDKYVQGVSQKAELPASRDRSRSRGRDPATASTAAPPQPDAPVPTPVAPTPSSAFLQLPPGLTIPWEHCGLVMPTFWSDRG